MISRSLVSSVFIWISFWLSEILFFSKLISSRSSFIVSRSCRISVSIDLIFLFVFLIVKCAYSSAFVEVDDVDLESVVFVLEL